VHHPFIWRRADARRATPLFVLFFLGLMTIAAHAQNAYTPLKPMYRVHRDSFLLGAWINAYQHRLRTDTTVSPCSTDYVTPLMSPWEYLDRLGVSTMRLLADPWDGEALLRELYQRKTDERAGNAARTQADKIILSHLSTDFPALPDGFREKFFYTETGYGSNVVLYPWNEVDQATWPARFMDTGSNVVTRLHPNNINGRKTERARERFLHDTNTVAGATIANNVVFNWAPRHTQRFPGIGVADTSIQNTSWPFENRRGALEGSSTYFVVVSARLTADGPAQDGAVLLRVVLSWERGPEDIIECATLEVSKGMLGGRVSSAYLDVAFPIDLAQCAGAAGPLAAGNTQGRRINLRVQWVGGHGEEVALRSISLREEPAHWLMDSTTTRGFHLRDSMRAHLGRMVAGFPVNDTNRRMIIGVAAGIEHSPPEADAFMHYRRFLKSNFPDPDSAWTSVPAWTEDGDHRALDRVDDSLQVVTVSCGIGGAAWMDGGFGVGVRGVPAAIEAHNGGRFHDPWEQYPPIPELELSPEGVEAYERSLQRISLGSHYAPTGMWQPFPMVPEGTSYHYTPGVSLLTHLGRRAELARDRNLRLIMILFNTHAFGFGTWC
jgi:hypothetical protein